MGSLKKLEKLKNIVKIFAYNGCEHIIAIGQNGEVYTYGYNA